MRPRHACAMQACARVVMCSPAVGTCAHGQRAGHYGEAPVDMQCWHAADRLALITFVPCAVAGVAPTQAGYAGRVTPCGTSHSSICILPLLPSSCKTTSLGFIYFSVLQVCAMQELDAGLDRPVLFEGKQQSFLIPPHHQGQQWHLHGTECWCCLIRLPCAC